ncbi:Hypothetical predicted protein [Scomber scombrus]|uniref:Uncharacterized protein n=1 Tax=Scomber scombrus TaxID=13677 RepID=A0AAV1NAF3_SCOSC
MGKLLCLQQPIRSYILTHRANQMHIAIAYLSLLLFLLLLLLLELLGNAWMIDDENDNGLEQAYTIYSYSCVGNNSTCITGMNLAPTTAKPPRKRLKTPVSCCKGFVVP